MLNFIPNDLTKEVGENGVWTGKLQEWNMTGDTVLVQEIRQSKVTKSYLMSTLKASPAINSVSSIAGGTSSLGTWLGDIFDAIAAAVLWVGWQLGIPGCYGWDSTTGQYQFNSWEWILGNSGRGGSSNGNGGSDPFGNLGYYSGIIGGLYSGNVPLNSSPTYISQNNWYAWQGSGGSGYYPSHDPTRYLLSFLTLSHSEATFIVDANNIQIAIALEKYILRNNFADEDLEFASWAVGYLKEDVSRFNIAFADLLNGIYNEDSPIYLPNDWDMQYPQSWFDEEEQLDAAALLFIQQNAPPSSMIPEMYYINGVKVDMQNAPVKTGKTVFNIPRNNVYFWKEVIAKKPQMFSENNRKLILSNPSKSPIVDAQWIKYNPTHKNYLNEPLHHHHEGQGRYAYAIPRKVHQKWSSILHQYKQTGKIPLIRPKINTMLGAFQVFTVLTDIETGNPDAWVNWFGPHQDVGKIYKHPEKGVYFEITKQTTTKNAVGKVLRAKVTYDVYDDYIWDADENRYMGVVKLGTFTEYIDLENKTTYDNSERDFL